MTPGGMLDVYCSIKQSCLSLIQQTAITDRNLLTLADIFQDVPVSNEFSRQYCFLSPYVDTDSAPFLVHS